MPKIKPTIKKHHRRVLELFKGTGSVEKAIYSQDPDVQIISVDIEAKWAPTILCDIMDLDYKQWAPGYFNTIWASPPCTHYSVMQRFNKHATAEQKQENVQRANEIVQRTLDIIDYLKPKYWYLENPQTGTLKDQDFMRDLPYCDATYCKYGYPYKKQTRFWTNVPVALKICCSKEFCAGVINGKHQYSIGTNSSGSDHKKGFRPAYKPLKLTLAQRYSIPQDLLIALLRF